MWTNAISKEILSESRSKETEKQIFSSDGTILIMKKENTRNKRLNNERSFVNGM